MHKKNNHETRHNVALLEACFELKDFDWGQKNDMKMTKESTKWRLLTNKWKLRYLY